MAKQPYYGFEFATGKDVIIVKNLKHWNSKKRKMETSTDLTTLLKDSVSELYVESQGDVVDDSGKVIGAVIFRKKIIDPKKK